LSTLLVGPVTHLGAPFPAVPGEAIIRGEVAGRDVCSFGEAHFGLDVDQDIWVGEPAVGAIILWDPSWIREGVGERRLHRMREHYQCPVVGVMSDWFAGWHGPQMKRIGTKRALDFCDRVIIDPYGASAIRRWGYKGEIRELRSYLSYGRLPTAGRLGLNRDVLGRYRYTDVCFVGHDHPGFIWQRPMILDAVTRACEARGWSYEIGADRTAEEMERLLQHAKVVCNPQLGTQPNMRCYEAAASGAALVCDAPAPPGAWQFIHPQDAVHAIRTLLEYADERLRCQQSVFDWVQNHTPELTWERIFDTALS
jgi:hypothetical protein